MSAPANDQAQALETIEMFEVIAQADPSDHLSLEILKESYFTLGKFEEVAFTSRRIAEAYLRSGQISLAILEYESILQLFPNDPASRQALSDIQQKATNLAAPIPAPAAAAAPPALPTKPAQTPPPSPLPQSRAPSGAIDDGRAAMQKIFVEGKHLRASEFDLFWKTPDLDEMPAQIQEPFLQLLADKQILPLEKSLKLLSEKTRLAFIALEKYDIDFEFARGFPRDVCLRWCILPFDCLSKTVLVATANPYNQQALRDLEEINAENDTRYRFLWYLVSPVELVKTLRKTFR